MLLCQNEAPFLNKMYKCQENNEKLIVKNEKQIILLVLTDWLNKCVKYIYNVYVCYNLVICVVNDHLR